MKRFSKILVLLLSLAAIITAFTVVALAEDAGPVNRTPAAYGDFEGSALFDYATSSSTGRLSYDRDTWATVQLQDNGEKYVVVTAAPADYKENGYTGTASNWSNAQWDVNLASNNTYNIVDYPYFMVELDITTLNGKYSGFQYNPRMYGASKNGFIGTLNFSDLGLSTKAYDWNHVSLLYVYVGEAKFDTYYYVNGVLASTSTKDLSASEPFKTDGTTETALKKVQIRSMKFYGDPSNDIRLDNMYFTCFPAGYLEGDEDVLTKIANYRFNNGEGYEFPFKYTVASITDAEGNTTPYDDVSEAISAATEGDTVRLHESVTEPVVVDKAIFIDANQYTTDEETGELVASGTYYELDYTSTQGYEAEYADGIYTFAKSANIVTVNWDPACEGECDCFADYGGHKLTASTIVTLGQIPVYPNETPTWSISTSDATQKVFLGWSYENDGTVDELTEVTEEQVALGTLSIYPVYATTQYAAEIIDVNGNSTYVKKEDVESVFSTATAGSTIKLHQDLFATKNAVSGGAFQVKKNLTLDLNGYNFGSVYITKTQYAATLGEDGSYVQGDATGVKTTTGATGYLFYQQHNGFEFTIMSSRPGATVSSLGINEDEWVCDGEVVNKVVTKYWGRGLFSLYPSNSTYNILGENITFYGQSLFYAEHGGNNANLSVNIDGGTYYIFRNADGNVGEGILALRRGGNHTVKNATFFGNGHPIVKSSWNSYTTITFDNCTLYDSSVHGAGITNVQYFNNCRLVNTPIADGSTASTYLGENTYVTAQSKYHADKGLLIVPDNTVSYSYRPVSSLQYTYDEESGEFVASFVFYAAETGTYSYTTDDITKYEDVLIDDANLSLLFTTNFDMMFYLPVEADYTVDMVVNYTKQSDTVWISGQEYYAYKRALTTSGAADPAPSTVIFTKDGISYTQTFHTDALVYAKLVLSDESVEAVEAKAVANMVRFIKEARTLAGVSVSDRFTELEALYALDGYKADTEYDALDVDYSGLTGVGMTFAVKGSLASYMLDLPVATFANAANATVTITLGDGNTANLTKTSNSGSVKTNYYWYTTNKLHISDMIGKTITVSITIPATDGGADTVLTGTYSVGAYVQETGNTFAKSILEFGAAAADYRAYLEEKYPDPS